MTRRGCGPRAAESYPLTAEEYHRGCRYTTPERLARHVGLTPGDETFEEVGAALGAEFDDRYVKLVDRDTAGFYPGVAGLLAELGGRRGVKLGALTNACVAYARAVLRANSEDDGDDGSPGSARPAPPAPSLFASVHGADSVPRPKPHGDGILLCCEEMGVDAGRTVYVGDSPTDARAARDAGCRAAVGVLWGSGSEESLREEGAFDVLCSSVEELSAAISGYLQ